MSGEREHRKKWLGRWLIGSVSIFLYLLSMVFGGLLLLAYLAPYVNPNQIEWISFLGMAAPFLYGVVFLLMLFWAVLWRWMAVVLGAVLLLGVVHVPKFFKPSISQSYHHVREPGTIRVLSYNVDGFFGKDSTGTRINRMDQISHYILQLDPDIICLQEFELNHVNPRIRFDTVLSDWKYRVNFQNPLSPDVERGLVIYSKYPLIRRGGINYSESTNASMWVDVILRRDTLRLYNNHLQTTQVDQSDRDYIGMGVNLADTASDRHLRVIFDKLGRNFKVRAMQADSVARYIHDGTPRVIVCGDFNDTPMSYTYHRMRGDFKDSFAQKGRGMVYTYRGLLDVFRIDYLFHSDDLLTVNYDSEQPPMSDHNPVVVDLRLR